MAEIVQEHSGASTRVRIFRSAGLGAAMAVMMFMLNFVTDLDGLRGGELWAPLVFGAFLAAAGAGGWGEGRGHRAAVAVAFAVGLAYGSWTSQVSMLSHGRLRGELDALKLPPSFHKMGDEKVGWSLCFDVCTAYDRGWRVDAPEAQARDAFVTALRARGFVFVPDDRHDVVARRGRLLVEADVGDTYTRESTRDGKSRVFVEASTWDGQEYHRGATAG